MTSEEKKVILVVDDEPMTVDLARRFLQERYEVLTAVSGEDGLELLKKYKVDLVLSDVVLPNMNGFEFMEQMKSMGLARIPVIIMTADHEPKREIMALESGAVDFVRKPLYAQILRNRIQNVLMRNQMEYDRLTGLYNRSRTFAQIRKMIQENPGKTFSFLRFDIDNFSLYNSSMGEEEGDRLLIYGTKALRGMSSDYDQCVYGRVDADVFCICAVFDRELLHKHMEEAIGYLGKYRSDYRLKASFGIYIFDDSDISVERVYTKASLAAHTCKGIYDKNYAYYEEWMEASFVEEQEIVNEMVGALEQKQFVPFLQPKYDLENDEPCGAEALVRWMHPIKGMISPGKFIPVFEKNGFIAKLDYYMWDQVCALIKKWKDEKQKLYPVSVNISRISMHNPNLVQMFQDLIKKYDLTPSLLQLEITESAYMTNPKLMRETIQRLQETGFTILMDDFGSGYSSLNTLKEIQVDILKVDMQFLPQRDIDTSERSEKILSSVIRMAGWLGIPTIAEGVETEAQRDFLRGIGCDYVQGYYYAKPMSVQAYEDLIARKGFAFEKNTVAAHSSAACSADEKVNEILSGIQLPVSIIEFSQSAVEVVRVNLQFSNTFGRKFEENIEENDRERIHKALAKAVERSTAEEEFVYHLSNGKVNYFRMKIKRLEKSASASLLCVIMIDISAEKLYGAQLRKLDRLIPDNNRARMLVIDDTRIMRNMIRELFSDSYEILEAENGQEGLEILKKEKDQLSIILLDMMMPVMNGKTFLKHKNSMKAVDDIPVIVMSADSDKELQLDMLASGVNDYITKPFDSRIFKQKVENAIMYAGRFSRLRNEYEKLLSEGVDIH